MRIWIYRRGPIDPSAPPPAPRAPHEVALYPVRLAVVTACTLAAFTVPAVLVPWRGQRTRTVVIAALVLIVAASGLAGGRGNGVVTAVMAGCSLDFFHDSTPQLLSLTSVGFWMWTAIFVGAALASAAAAGPARARRRPLTR